MVKNACDAGDPGSIPGMGRSAGEGMSYPLQHSWASLLVKNPPAMRETWVQSPGSIPGLGRSSGEGNLLQYSGWQNSMDCIEFHGVIKSRTRLSNFHFHFTS